MEERSQERGKAQPALGGKLKKESVMAALDELEVLALAHDVLQLPERRLDDNREEMV